MRTFRLTPDAQSDLIEIRRYTLQQWGSPQSHKYLSEIRHVMGLLVETPSMGKLRPDIGSDVLSFVHASHVIYYLVHTQQLVVFGVLHKRMVPLNHLVERTTI